MLEKFIFDIDNNTLRRTIVIRKSSPATLESANASHAVVNYTIFEAAAYQIERIEKKHVSDSNNLQSAYKIKITKLNKLFL